MAGTSSGAVGNNGVKRWATPQDVVWACSAGAMLRGVLHGRDGNDVDTYHLTTQRLLEVPDNQTLLGPTLGTRTEITELKTEYESKAFEKSIRNTEISLDAKTQFKGLCNSAKIGGGVKIGKVDNKTVQTNITQKYYSKVKSTMFAAASVKLEKNTLKLSDGALNAINHIQDVDKNTKASGKDEKRRDLYQLCANFFENFGTHVNCGIFHLGGIVTQTSTCECSSATSMNQIEKVVNTALNAHAGVGYSGIGAEVSVARMKKDGKITQNFEKELETNTKVVCQQYGGRPITKYFDEDAWKNNLLLESTNWVVIDRGDSDIKDHVGVWDILSKGKSEEQAKGLHDMLYGYSSAYFYRSQIYRIIEERNHPALIADGLKDISKITQGRFYDGKDKVTKEWLELLQDDENVAMFLLTPKSYLPNICTHDLEKILLALGQLVSLTGKYDFAKKEEIIQMTREVSLRIYNRERVKVLLKAGDDPNNQLLQGVKSLRPGDWLQMLKEDESIPNFLLNSLKGKQSRKIQIGKTTEKKSIVRQLVQLAGSESFKYKDDIISELDIPDSCICVTH